MFIVWIVFGIIVIVAAWVGFWRLVSIFVERSSRQQPFLHGNLPSPPPKGFYNGSAFLLGNRPVPWLGKAFEPEKDRGYNVFTPTGASLLKVMTPFYKLFSKDDDGNTAAYFFKTSTGQGFKDKGIETFKLDYNSPGNPFLIRIILDEIVETAPDEFLGKVHVKVFPRYYTTIGFFGLRKG